MAKIGKPRGLIDYMALSDEPRERAGQPPRSVWKHIFRPRTIMYTTLWSLVGFGLLFALFIRSDIEMTVAPIRNPTYVTLSDGSIRNTYDVRLLNKHGEERQFKLSVTGDPSLADPARRHPVPVDPGAGQRDPAAAGLRDRAEGIGARRIGGHRHPLLGRGSEQRRARLQGQHLQRNGRTEPWPTGSLPASTRFCSSSARSAVIIAVNIVLAVSAVRTFPGLEVKNSYVASQEFDKRRKAQEALGWTVSAETTGTEVVLRIDDATGAAAPVATLDATIGRATDAAHEFAPGLRLRRRSAMRRRSRWDRATGMLRLAATARDGTEFTQRIVLFVKDAE